MRFQFVFFILLAISQTFAQQIDNRECKAFTDRPFFNTEFIQRNKIKSITGSIALKREGDRIRQQDLIEVFTFDERGRQTSKINTSRSSTSSTDTSVVLFEYDNNNNVITIRKSDSYGFFSDNFKYDSIGRVIKKSYCRDENSGKGKFDFKLKKQFEITSENYIWSGTPGKTQSKKYFNNYKRPYKEEEFTWNEFGYFMGSKSRTFMGNKRSETSYSYNENGLVFKLTEQPDLDKLKKIINEYEYDALGNLSFHKKYKNGTQLYARDLIYDESNFLLSSQVFKDMKSGIITITKYTYEFYE